MTLCFLLLGGGVAFLSELIAGVPVTKSRLCAVEGAHGRWGDEGRGGGRKVGIGRAEPRQRSLRPDVRDSVQEERDDRSLTCWQMLPG